MFCGCFKYLISNKDELTLPVHFRRGRKKVIIGAWPEGCLFLFSKKEWKRTTRKGKDWPSLNREESRIIFSHVIEVEIDEKGKIKIPEDLKKQVGLEREIITAGCGRYIEVWDEKRWEIECERTKIIMKALYDGETVTLPLKVSSN